MIDCTIYMIESVFVRAKSTKIYDELVKAKQTNELK